jgi:hypothetical protein
MNLDDQTLLKAIGSIVSIVMKTSTIFGLGSHAKENILNSCNRHAANIVAHKNQSPLPVAVGLKKNLL